MSDVEEIKSRLDIVQVIGESVPLKKAGRNLKGLCPFHQEKTPSFTVNPERQTYHCFGCGEGGDIFEFVMKREAADFPEALRMLAKRAGVELKGFDSKASKAKQRLFEANDQAAKYFVAALKHASGKVAQEYLKSRGITDATAEQFRIGYAPDSYDAMVDALKKKGFTAKELEDAGLVIPGRRGPYARFRGRLMIPIADSSGVVRGFTGRVLDPDAKEAKYVNTPETDVYHKGKLVFALDLAKQAAINEDSIVMVEGQMDVITAHQAGTPNVVATSGTALTEEQLRQMLRFTKTLVLALDDDAAGRKALLRTIELVGDREAELKAVDMGGAKDPDELISKDPKAWAKQLKDSPPVIDYLITSALRDEKAPYSREVIKQVLDTVLPALAYRPGIDQDFYTEQLATTLGVEKSSIKAKLAGPKTVQRVNNQESEQTPVTPPQKSAEELVSELMVGLVAMTPKLSLQFAKIDPRIFPESYREAAEVLKTGYNKLTVNKDTQSLIDVCAMAASDYDALSTEERAAEFDRLYDRLKSLWIKQHQPKLLAAIKRAETGGNVDRRNQLMDEYMTITKHVAHG
jgi:DNA primase